MNEPSEVLRRLPAVNVLLATPEVTRLISSFGKDLILFCIRDTLDHFRQRILAGASAPGLPDILEEVQAKAVRLRTPSLKKVINATGVIIHTNLGRAPLGKAVAKKSLEVLEGYNNLEFDIEKGSRGDRNVHAAEIIRYLTGAEDVLVVNNNAAAVMLILRTFARRKEVIVSRGELVEIGGSFRVPEVMAASDCKMVEVGTTNKTRIEDFREAITAKTSVLFKAHRSNFVISGFTEEASIEELVALGAEKGLPVVFDLGSGMLRPVEGNFTSQEPDVQTLLKKGVDLLCFSGDKLLGGPQAGIIVGKKEYIAKLKKQPMLRALRVCKLTISVLEATCLSWLENDGSTPGCTIHEFLGRSKTFLKSAAEKCKAGLAAKGITAEIEASEGQVGGGTLPDIRIPSFTVRIVQGSANKIRSTYAERMYHGLLHSPVPVLSILKQGSVGFDMLCLTPDEMDIVVEEVAAQHLRILNPS